MKIRPTEWEKVFTNPAVDEVFIVKTCIFKKERILNDIFP